MGVIAGNLVDVGRKGAGHSRTDLQNSRHIYPLGIDHSEGAGDGGGSAAAPMSEAAADVG